LAWLPELGWTLANSQSNSLLGALDRQFSRQYRQTGSRHNSAARIAFGVFVGHHRALRFHHGARDDVFRRDQLDLVLLDGQVRP
jgi:hypothetical protein